MPTLSGAINGALAPVLAALHATGAPIPIVTAANPSAPGEHALWLSNLAGKSTGLAWPVGESAVELTQRVTEVVQEWAIEERWVNGSNWPACPEHPTSHPLEPRIRGDDVWWWCPKSGGPIARVGTLSADQHSQAG